MAKQATRSAPTILIIGTCDTKADELQFMRRCIEEGGGKAALMDVGVLGRPAFAPEHRNEDVAAAAGTTIAAIAALGDENEAMTEMARGAARLARRLHDEGKVQGMIALGGTMGTDLALDVAAALPLGVPKFVVSTVAYSHLLPPQRITPDLMMILWAGGLYGLNSICKAALSQAAGAVLGAARAVVRPQAERPVIGMTSLGKTCLNYMVALKPALEARGYEVAVFHCTGMGGQAMEALARQRKFVAILDFCLAEVANELHGSVVGAGPGRLEGAGANAIPQIVAPGASDMLDFQTWKGVPERFKDRPYRAHNRLIASITMTPAERRHFAGHIAGKLAKAKGPTKLILPLQGIHAWDRPGEALHSPDAHAAFIQGFRESIKPPVELIELDAHINDRPFTDLALAIVDGWIRDGVMAPGAPARAA